MIKCGVFDSGIGGLTVAKELINSFNDIEISYFADFHHLPYGPRPLEDVKGFALGIIDFLFSSGVDIVVMGCNMSVASGADKAWREKSDKPVFEIVTPACEEAVKRSAQGNIGVICTEGTFKSNIYTHTLKNAGAKSSTVVPCPKFVPLIESETCKEEEKVNTIKEYLAKINDADCDTLIYGCTHYPFLEREILSEIGDSVQIVNPAETITEIIRKYIENFSAQHNDCEIQTPLHKFYCTGEKENLIKFAPFLGQKIEEIKIVKELE